jgi:hypothetical protein
VRIAGNADGFDRLAEVGSWARGELSERHALCLWCGPPSLTGQIAGFSKNVMYSGGAVLGRGGPPGNIRTLGSA